VGTKELSQKKSSQAESQLPKNQSGSSDKEKDALSMIEESAFNALKYYSNVHRGSGHKSLISTQLFERARKIVLDYLELNAEKYWVIFCSARGFCRISRYLDSKSFLQISADVLQLSIDVTALAVEKEKMPEEIPFYGGGGTTRLMGQEWYLNSKMPERFEPGTPSVIAVITFVRALQLKKQLGDKFFFKAADLDSPVEDFLYHDEFESLKGLNLLNKLRETMVGHKIKVPTAIGEENFINFDNAASTSALLPAWNVYRKMLFQNERMSSQIVSEVKKISSEFLDAPQDQYDIHFTTNTTEAFNLLAENFSNSGQHENTVILSSLLEHTSNDLPWRSIPGAKQIRLTLDENGFLKLDDMEKILREYNQDKIHGEKRIKIVALCGVSNVLGFYNDLKRISEIVHKYGAYLFVDAAQWIAHRKMDMNKWDIDGMAFSAHKIYAPFGAGALVIRKGILQLEDFEINSFAKYEEKNAAGIAALGKSLLLLQRVGMDVIQKEEQKITSKALNDLSKLEIKGLRLHGFMDPDTPEFEKKGGVVAFDIKEKSPRILANRLAEVSGIGTRYGCHCAHILVKHLVGIGTFLEKFQRLMLKLLPNLELQGVVRISFGIENTQEDVDVFVNTLKGIHEKSEDAGNKGKIENQFNKSLRKETKLKMEQFAQEKVMQVFAE